MIELDILIEEIELSNMSRVSKKYIYENLLDIRQNLQKQLTLCDVGCSKKTGIQLLSEWVDSNKDLYNYRDTSRMPELLGQIQWFLQKEQGEV